MDDLGWDFDSAFSTAAGVIPTLLLALVLERRLLPVAVTFARYIRDQAQHQPGWLRSIEVISPSTYQFAQASLELMQQVSMIMIAVFAVFAEMIALFGVAMPSAWVERTPGRLLAFVGLGFVGLIILILLMMITLGLLAVVAEVETDDTLGDVETTPEERLRRESSGGTGDPEST